VPVGYIGVVETFPFQGCIIRKSIRGHLRGQLILEHLELLSMILLIGDRSLVLSLSVLLEVGAHALVFGVLRSKCSGGFVNVIGFDQL